MDIKSIKFSLLALLVAIALNLGLVAAEIAPDRQFIEKEIIERVIPKEIEAEYEATLQALLASKEKKEDEQLIAKLATLNEKTTLKLTKNLVLEHHIKPGTFYPFSEKLIQYLKSKEVPTNLKLELDKLFGSKKASQLLLLNQAENQEWALKWALNNRLGEEQEANCYMGALANVMEKVGFKSIFSDKWDTNHHIYVHPNFPEHVFKCIPNYQFHIVGRHSGWLNISRIQYAEKFTEHIKNKKPPYKTKFTIPKKWAYFVPGGSRYAGSIIVVTERINLSTQYPLYAAPEQMFAETWDVLKAMKYTDFDNDGNVISRAEPYNDVVFLDTEHRVPDIKGEEFDKLASQSSLFKLRSRL